MRPSRILWPDPAPAWPSARGLHSRHGRTVVPPAPGTTGSSAPPSSAPWSLDHKAL